MSRLRAKIDPAVTAAPELAWLRSAYHFHTFAYRDPRSAFASGIALPVVSPTTVLLGVVSTLFSIGEALSAKRLLDEAHLCSVIVDAPAGTVFFRAFHQLRRYETLKYGSNPRFGLTKINQGTREYGLVDGQLTVYVGVPEQHTQCVDVGLTNLRHLGTSDSLCSLAGMVERCDMPTPAAATYMTRDEFSRLVREQGVAAIGHGVTVVTLSTFKKGKPVSQTMGHWKMAGDQVDTELVPYVIKGAFQGTTRGRIYRKN